jgi:CDGSH-type Zn-finger protein
MSERREPSTVAPRTPQSVSVTEDGPYVISGGVPLARQVIVMDKEKNSIGWQEGESLDAADEYELCRCGHSANKPYCDDSHHRVGFDGTETASRAPYLEGAGEQDGPIVTLTDNEQLCAFARFCDVGGQVWNLAQEPNQQAADLAVLEAELCPSGRLVAWNSRTRAAFEPELTPSIGLVEDPGEQVSGPIWVRGGITVTAADGTAYEVRNRVTLCRCGASRNKPFCDGTHAAVGFRDDS